MLASSDLIGSYEGENKVEEDKEEEDYNEDKDATFLALVVSCSDVRRETFVFHPNNRRLVTTMMSFVSNSHLVLKYSPHTFQLAYGQAYMQSYQLSASNSSNAINTSMSISDTHLSSLCRSLQQEYYEKQLYQQQESEQDPQQLLDQDQGKEQQKHPRGKGWIMSKKPAWGILANGEPSLLCSMYPMRFLAPTSISREVIIKAAPLYHKNMFPVFSWRLSSPTATPSPSSHLLGLFATSLMS